MTRKEYSSIHSSIQKIGSSNPGAWFFSKTQHHIDRILIKLTNGRTTLTAILSGLPVLVLTTTGAKSGKIRTTPLIYIQDRKGSREIALIASNYGQGQNPGWYYNLKANPLAACSIDGKDQEYFSHEAEGEEYTSFWQAAMDVYFGFPNYQERAGDRHIPIMVLDPIED